MLNNPPDPLTDGRLIPDVGSQTNQYVIIGSFGIPWFAGSTGNREHPNILAAHHEYKERLFAFAAALASRIKF